MPHLDYAKLRAARVSAGLSPEAAALTMGCSASAVHAWERGQNTPPANVLLRLARVYGVTVESLTADDPDDDMAGAR